MKTPAEQYDYGIYIDQTKAFIIVINEFDHTQPAHMRIELNPEPDPINGGGQRYPKEKKSAYTQRMRAFTTKIIGHLQLPHRILLFGPSEDKYELHKELERQGFDYGMKELIVSTAMDEAVQAQRFTEKYFITREPF